jgi:acetyl esterase/lipase
VIEPRFGTLEPRAGARSSDRTSAASKPSAATRLRLLAEVAATALAVARARSRRGPMRPSWSFATELVAMTQKRILTMSKRRGIAWLREVQAGLPTSTPLDTAVRFAWVDAGGVRALWCVPLAPGPIDRVVLYCHGGGYVIGSPDSHREIVARLAVGARARVLSLDYRLSPEAPFPAAQEDCHRALEWLLEQGIDPATIALAGDSAGGALSLATLLVRRDAGLPLPACAILICPWVDPLSDGGSVVENEPYDFGDRDLLLAWIRSHAKDPQIGMPALSPLVADLRGLPPLLVQAGAAEILLDQITSLAESARASGVDVTFTVYPDMFHDFQMMARLVPVGVKAVEEMVTYLERLLVGAPGSAAVSGSSSG